MRSAIQTEIEPVDRLHRDNGFATLEAMRAAHRPIVDLATAAIGGRSARVVDLGCGNGELLAQICVESPRAEPFGVDRNEAAIDLARLLHPDRAKNFQVGSVLEFPARCWHDTRFDLVILMPGRLLEASPDAAESFLEALDRAADRLLVYAYSDWIARYGSLDVIARRAGLDLEPHAADRPVGLARPRPRSTIVSKSKPSNPKPY